MLRNPSAVIALTIRQVTDVCLRLLLFLNNSITGITIIMGSTELAIKHNYIIIISVGRLTVFIAGHQAASDCAASWSEARCLLQLKTPCQS